MYFGRKAGFLVYFWTFFVGFWCLFGPHEAIFFGRICLFVWGWAVENWVRMEVPGKRTEQGADEALVRRGGLVARCEFACILR